MFSGEIKSPKSTEFTLAIIVASMQAFKMAERSNTFTYVYHY